MKSELKQASTSVIDRYLPGKANSVCKRLLFHIILLSDWLLDCHICQPNLSKSSPTEIVITTPAKLLTDLNPL